MFVQEAKPGHMACEPYIRTGKAGGREDVRSDGEAVKPPTSLGKK